MSVIQDNLLKCKCGGIWFNCEVKTKVKMTAYAKPVDNDVEIEEDTPKQYIRLGPWECCDCSKIVKNRTFIATLDKLLNEG